MTSAALSSISSREFCCRTRYTVCPLMWGIISPSYSLHADVKYGNPKSRMFVCSRLLLSNFVWTAMGNFGNCCRALREPHLNPEKFDHPCPPRIRSTNYRHFQSVEEKKLIDQNVSNSAVMGITKSKSWETYALHFFLRFTTWLSELSE